MSKKSEKALKECRAAIHNIVQHLDAADYRDVLENLSCDHDGAIEALDEEAKNEEDEE